MMLSIPESDGTCLIEPGNILRVEASNNYSKIHFTNKRNVMVVSKVLRWVQERLPADMFIRIHRSHLVNRKQVKGIEGGLVKRVELTNGECVPVSRRKQALVKHK